MTNPMQRALAALALHPRCGARSRRTGLPCKNPSMLNGRCRMHGGKSTGRPIVHGRNTREAKGRRTQAREELDELRRLLQELDEMS